MMDWTIWLNEVKALWPAKLTYPNLRDIFDLYCKGRGPREVVLFLRRRKRVLCR
jgi:hypothetical protein